LELISDLERFIPGYFNQLPPTASDDEKFESLLPSLKVRHKDWLRWGGYENLGGASAFTPFA
jgi:hypothetical protein